MIVASVWTLLHKWRSTAPKHTSFCTYTSVQYTYSLACITHWVHKTFLQVAFDVWHTASHSFALHQSLHKVGISRENTWNDNLYWLVCNRFPCHFHSSPQRLSLLMQPCIYMNPQDTSIQHCIWSSCRYSSGWWTENQQRWNGCIVVYNEIYSLE